MCAEDSEVSLVHLVDVLNRSGRAPEVIAGVEHDTTLLSSATDRTRGAALFVLCQSSELDRSQVLRLSGLFSARKGPQHELLVVDVDGSASLDALPLIEAAMESLSEGSAESAEASAALASRVPKRDVVVMPGDSVGSGSIPNFDEEEGKERQLRLDPGTPQAPAVDTTDAESDAGSAAALAMEAVAEQESREAAERESQEAAARAAAEREAREAAEREAAEQAARDAAEREAREAAERAAAEREAAEQRVRDDAEALARSFHEEMVAAEAVLERRSSRRTVPEPAATGSAMELGDGVPVLLQADQAETRPLGLEEPIAITVPDPVEPPGDELSLRASEAESLAESGEQVGVEWGPPVGAESGEESGSDSSDELGLLSTSLSGVRVADPLASVPIPDAIQTELTPTDTRRRRREPDQTDTHTAAGNHEARESRSGWLLAIAGAAALGGLGLFVMRGGAGDEGGQRTASVAATPSGGSRATPAPKASAPRRADAETPRVVAEPDAKPAAKPTPPAEPDAPVKPSPQGDSVDAERPSAESKPVLANRPGPGSDETSEPEPDETAKPQPDENAKPGSDESPEQGSDESPEDVEAPAIVSTVPPAPTDSEALRIDLAIRGGKIRAVDTLLVAHPGTEEVDWAQAKSQCRRKRVGGLPGWRLPSRRQLNRLRRSRLLGSGTYWSRERGPHDDDAFAVDAESNESHLYLVVEPAARVQCVRKR